MRHVSGRSVWLIVRPARGPGSLPAGIHTDGSDPPRLGGGCATPGATPGATPTPSADRASGQKWGVAPVQSLPAGASRVVRSRTKNHERGQRTMDAWCATPHPLLLPHPPLCPRGISPALRPALRPATERDRNEGHHQIAASGPVSREVDQIWKRSIATRAFVVVGVPSGSCRSALSRFAAVLNPPSAASTVRSPPVIAPFK